MKRKSMPEGRTNRVRGKMTGRLCSLLIAAMLAGGMPSGTIVSTYAAQTAGAGNVGKNAQGGQSDAEKAEDADETEDRASEGNKMEETGAEEQTGGTDADDKKDESTPTPAEGEETSPRPTTTAKPRPTPTEEPQDTAPTPTGEPKNTPAPTMKEDTQPSKDAEPTGDREPENATPAPTKKPKKTPTPMPENDEQPTVTEGAQPTPGEGEEPEDATPTPGKSKEPEDATPTPTKKPKKTPTPTPQEQEPNVTEGAEPTPEGEQEPSTPTPTPTKKPASSSSWVVPTESDDARYQYILGIDSTVITIDNPPAGYKSAAEAARNMKTITIPVWKMTASGGRYASSAQLTVNKKLAKNVQQIFKEIYALKLKFPIKVIKGYMYRKVGGVGLSKSRIMSIHSFGAAIDINPDDYDNDYYLGKGNDLRDRSNPYCIPDEVIEIFEKYGWFWGGNFEICADTMHFQYFELGMLTYQGNSPFRTLRVKSGYMSGTDVRNLQQRLCELGFSVSIDGVYGSKTANAIKIYQKSRGLAATGEVDYKTWETIINETHYMAYAF